MKLRISLIAVLLASAGCTQYSSNLQVGNEQIYTSLKDQREALRTVRQYEALPAGAEVLGPVEAGRCHRSWVEKEPDESSLLIDLKVAAFAKGADGITDVKFSKDSGLNRNCWYILGGSAVMFALPQKTE